MSVQSTEQSKTFKHLIVHNRGSSVELEDKDIPYKYYILVNASSEEAADELEKIAKWLRTRR